MVEEAAYSIEKQYEALLFHHHWSVSCTVALPQKIIKSNQAQKVPYLGPAPPSDDVAKWKSLLTVDSTPIEYSWKWNTPTSDPDVRFTVEPINQFTGTALDPLNHSLTQELLHRLDNIMPTVDLTWFHHFLSTLYDHDKAKYMQEVESGVHPTTTMSVAFEFVRKGMSTKTYFAPRKLGQAGLMPLPQWESVIRQLDPTNAALDVLNQFLESSPEGKMLNSFMLAIDNVHPSSARMKFYFQTPRTSFASVREIMTLGGRITGINEQLEDLHDLIKAVTALPADFPEDAKVPAADQYNPSAKDNFVELPILLSGYLYYFDVAPGGTLPEIKFYTPVRRYGRDDLSLAKSITGWMEAKARGAYCQSYLRMLESLAEHRSLNEGQGLQTYVSCIFKKSGELDITAYLAPEAFHQVRLAGNTAR